MNIHTIETYGPHWTCFLRRTRYGNLANDYEGGQVNAAWAMKSDPDLKRLAALGDVDGCHDRLAVLGIEVSWSHVVALIEGARQ